jgi:hypothetical protein
MRSLSQDGSFLAKTGTDILYNARQALKILIELALRIHG